MNPILTRNVSMCFWKSTWRHQLDGMEITWTTRISRRIHISCEPISRMEGDNGLHCSIRFWIEHTPPKTNMKPEKHPFEKNKNSFSTPSFLGSILVFVGVGYMLQSPWAPGRAHTHIGNLNLWPILPAGWGEQGPTYSFIIYRLPGKVDWVW